MAAFDDLLAEGQAVPVEGWDFSWFQGRGTEQRPSWGYSRLLADRMAQAQAGLDIQTGGGEVLSGIPVVPPVLVATEGWPPNVAVARRQLAALQADVVQAGNTADLPFADNSFDLVVSRHPSAIRWDEVSRVLRPGGTYLSQGVGSASVRELTDFLKGPQRADLAMSAMTAAASAEQAGLDVVDLRQEALRMEFFDIAAVVHFLRKVIWIVPGFTTDTYRTQLREIHDFIQRHGPFIAHSQRYLIEARPAHR
ncbi:class I SAM-dependent methyltransferase [Streptomyces sp. NPDC003032]